MIEKTTWFQLQPLYRHLREEAEKKKSYKYLEVGATFFLIAVFLFTAIAPTAKAISNLIGEIKSKQVTEKKLRDKINSIILAQDNYSMMQENSRYQILESSFPSRPRYYHSALAFSSASNQDNSTLNQISFNLSPKESEKIESQSYSVNITTKGDYSSSLEVLNKIADNRRLTELESIQFRQLDKKEMSASSSGYINLNISTNLFYLPTISNDKK